MTTDVELIIGGLQLAREQVTADTIEQKQAWRDAYQWEETGEGKPSAEELRRLWRDMRRGIPMMLAGPLERWDDPDDMHTMQDSGGTSDTGA
jgi:hypothetical protein